MRSLLSLKSKCLTAVVALVLSSPLAAQVPNAAASEAMQSIGVITDGGLTGTGVDRKALVVPHGQTFRLTDLSLATRRADTAPGICVVEVHRGTEAGPTALAWTRLKITGSEPYDRSWQTPPTFGPGEVIWLRAFFDPFNTGQRTCVRLIPNLEAEMHYALRGYLVRQASQ